MANSLIESLSIRKSSSNFKSNSNDLRIMRIDSGALTSKLEALASAFRPLTSRSLQVARLGISRFLNLFGFDFHVQSLAHLQDTA